MGAHVSATIDKEFPKKKQQGIRSVLKAASLDQCVDLMRAPGFLEGFMNKSGVRDEFSDRLLDKLDGWNRRASKRFKREKYNSELMRGTRRDKQRETQFVKVMEAILDCEFTACGDVTVLKKYLEHLRASSCLSIRVLAKFLKRFPTCIIRNMFAVQKAIASDNARDNIGNRVQKLALAFKRDCFGWHVEKGRRCYVNLVPDLLTLLCRQLGKLPYDHDVNNDTKRDLILRFCFLGTVLPQLRIHYKDNRNLDRIWSILMSMATSPKITQWKKMKYGLTRPFWRKHHNMILGALLKMVPEDFKRIHDLEPAARRRAISMSCS